MKSIPLQHCVPWGGGDVSRLMKLLLHTDYSTKFTSMDCILGRRYDVCCLIQYDANTATIQGWNMTLRGYQEKIRELIGKMFAILPSIPPENQTSVNEYINKIYVSTATIYESVHPCIVNHRLQSRFQSYVEMEEHRLRLNLESIRYDIDGSETLELVTGPGRIERVCSFDFHLQSPFDDTLFISLSFHCYT